MAILSKGTCPKCTGRGAVPRDGSTFPALCSRCEGSGRAVLSEEESRKAAAQAFAARLIADSPDFEDRPFCRWHRWSRAEDVRIENPTDPSQYVIVRRLGL